MEVLKAVSTEAYNIFHTVSFIESNVTHNLSPRKVRFWQEPQNMGPSAVESPQLNNIYQLYQLYGPKTKVSVDLYSSTMKGGHDLLRDFVQREGNNLRWRINGMQHDDVAIVGDTDETFTRDFLRALQICDIQSFRPNQDCRASKVMASTMVFESTPECITNNRRWYHPDAVIGECVDKIGNATLHPPTKREWPHGQTDENTTYHGYRVDGYGRGSNFSLYHAEHKLNSTYPLYYATDVRMEPSQESWRTMKDGSPAGKYYPFLSLQAFHSPTTL